MRNLQEPEQIMDGDYSGRILRGQYSNRLRRHIKDLIDRFRAFDEAGSPAIPYISAWEEKGDTIWYEFISKRFIEVLGSTYLEAPESFRKNIIERHVYKYHDVGSPVRQEVISRKGLKKRRTGLRDEAKKRGFVEAVYKIESEKGKAFWVKDLASVESYEEDGIYISLGCLTIVTKEMVAEEHLNKTKEALRKSEEKFRKLAIHDNLTGLYNTRYLYQALSELISESLVSKQPFSLIFMDIDDFKQVVDTHGHLKASQTLQEFASTLQETLQEPAYAVAYGGDEFVMVLPGLNKRQALHMAENVRSRIGETLYLRGEGLRVRLRASFGVSTFPDDATSLSEMLALADQAMFFVKERGKNSVSGITFGGL
ncbi:MAG: GGDEF domain-containing protein [Desulfobacteraceae bacterium]|nr:GGDEF domain-containing protein [Desulfobacteraceae bacterium]